MFNNYTLSAMIQFWDGPIFFSHPYYYTIQHLREAAAILPPTLFHNIHQWYLNDTLAECHYCNYKVGQNQSLQIQFLLQDLQKLQMQNFKNMHYDVDICYFISIISIVTLMISKYVSYII